MIQDAVISIHRADEEALRRRHVLRSRRRPIQLLDHWLNQVETLIERNDVVVPEPLISEIARFLGKLNPRLHRRLRRNGKREAVRVLDVLFEAEEEFLPTTAEPAEGRALQPVRGARALS